MKRTQFPETIIYHHMTNLPELDESSINKSSDPKATLVNNGSALCLPPLQYMINQIPIKQKKSSRKHRKIINIMRK